MRGKGEISNYQRDLMRHTISNPGRNWFGTSLGRALGAIGLLIAATGVVFEFLKY